MSPGLRSTSLSSGREADVYIWCYALLVVHARKEEKKNCKVYNAKTTIIINRLVTVVNQLFTTKYITDLPLAWPKTDSSKMLNMGYHHWASC